MSQRENKEAIASKNSSWKWSICVPASSSSVACRHQNSPKVFDTAEKGTALFHEKGGIAVLSTGRILILTLSRKHRHHDCWWCDCERAVTERMKERESLLDEQWYRGRVRAQFRKDKLETRGRTKNGRRKARCEREREWAREWVGGRGRERERERERARVARSVRACVRWSYGLY